MGVYIMSIRNELRHLKEQLGVIQYYVGSLPPFTLVFSEGSETYKSRAWDDNVVVKVLHGGGSLQYSMFSNQMVTIEINAEVIHKTLEALNKKVIHYNKLDISKYLEGASSCKLKELSLKEMKQSTRNTMSSKKRKGSVALEEAPRFSSSLRQGSVALFLTGLDPSHVLDSFVKRVLDSQSPSALKNLAQANRAFYMLIERWFTCSTQKQCIKPGMPLRPYKRLFESSSVLSRGI